MNLKNILSRSIAKSLELQSFITSALKTETINDDSPQTTALEERIMLSATPMALVADVPTVEPADSADDATAQCDTPQNDSTQTTRNVVFVDSSVDDYQQLVDDIRQQGDDSAVVLIDGSSDGVDQITDYLSEHSGIESVHIVSHGTDGEVQLGNTVLNADTIERYAGQIASWGNSLTSSADILFYGCDLAATDDGQHLIDSLSALTGADIVASDDITGNADLGGDWELEYAVGEIETDVIFSAEVQRTFASTLQTFTVDTLADVVDDNDGFTSLREAVLAANSTFNEPAIIELASGVHELSISGGGNASSGDLDINTNIEFIGKADGSSVIDASDLGDRVFEITFNETIFRDVTIEGGNTTEATGGGGILLAGGASLELHNVEIRDSMAVIGGGIRSSGDLTVTNSTFDGNTATTQGGGGIAISGGTSDFENVTFSENSAESGGAVILSNGTHDFVNATLSGNTATTVGGGIAVTSGTVTFENATITNNTAGTNGGGISRTAGTVNVAGSIVALNFSSDSNTTEVSGTINASNENIIDDSSGLSLGTLSDNGGSVQTHALLSGSDGIDTANSATAPATDARGVARDGNPDIGAFEFGQITGRPVLPADEEVFISENTTLVGTFQAFDPDGDALTYSLTGTDAALFNINSSTGEVSFVSAPDFEMPTDSDADNIYDFDVIATDPSGLFDSQRVTVFITANAVNDAPVIGGFQETYLADLTPLTEDSALTFIANAGHQDAQITFDGENFFHGVGIHPEGNRSVTEYALDGATNFSAIVGINDTLNSPGNVTFRVFVDGVEAFNSGVVTDTTPPMFVDIDTTGGSVLRLEVDTNGMQASDHAVFANAALTGSTTQPTTISLAETAVNGTVVGTYEGSDPNGDSLSYSLVNDAGGRFAIDSNTGVITVADDSEIDFESIDSHTITVRIDDGMTSTDDTVTINLTDVNEGPTGTNSTISILEDSSHTFTIDDFGFVDAEGDMASSIVVTSIPTGGTLTLDGVTVDGVQIVPVENLQNLVYTPAIDANGDDYDSFDFVVRDSRQRFSSDTNTLTFDVTPVTDDRAVSVAENTTTVVGTFTNFNSNGNDLTYSLTGADAELFNIDGSTGEVTFVSAPNFEAPLDSNSNNVYDITAVATNAAGAFVDSENVQVTVTNVNEAPILADFPDAPVNENTTLVGTFEGNDPDGDALTYSLGGQDGDDFTIDTATGEVNFRVAPDYENPQDIGENNVRFIEVIATDDEGLTSGESVRVVVTNVNEAPTLADFPEIVVNEDTAFMGTLEGDDPEGDTLTFNTTPVSGPDNGVLTLDSDGNFTYTPNDNFYGTDSFTYQVSDGNGETAQATVDITVNPVNDAPITTPVTLEPIAEDSGTLIITQADLLINAEDVDGDTLVATDLMIISGNGTLVDNGDGTWSYTPALNDNSEVQFSYSVEDNQTSVAAIANLDITPVDDSLVAVGESISIDEDESFTSAPQDNLLLNDTSIDADSLSVNTTPFTAPTAGTVSLNSDGSYTYTPDADFFGTDSFTYEVVDSNGVTATATVEITVNPANDAPITTPVTLEPIAEDSGTLIITQADLLINAEDTDGDTLVATDLMIISGNGTLVDNGDGTWSYTPAANDDTQVTFNYTVGDGSTATNTTATLDITPVNDAPVLPNDTTIPFNEGTNSVGTFIGDDVDGEEITYELTGPDADRFNISSDGEVTFVSPPDFETPLDADSDNVYEFTIIATDDGAGALLDQQNVRVVVTDLNDSAVGPVADVNTALNSVDENSAMGSLVGITADAVDADATENVVTYSLQDNDGGRFAIDAGTGEITVAGDIDFETDGATRNIVVRAQSEDGSFSDQTFTLTINDVNEAPTVAISGVVFSVPETTDTSDGIRIANIVVSDDALGTNQLSLSGADAGVFEIVGNELRLRPGTELDLDNLSQFDVNIDVNDATIGGPVNDSVSHTLSVSESGSILVANNDVYEINQFEEAVISIVGVLANDTDSAEQDLTATLVSNPSNGEVVLNPDGTFVYTPNNNFSGTDSFTYQATSATSSGSIATVEIEVLPVAASAGPGSTDNSSNSDSSNSQTASENIEMDSGEMEASENENTPTTIDSATAGSTSPVAVATNFIDRRSETQSQDNADSESDEELVPLETTIDGVSVLYLQSSDSNGRTEMRINNIAHTFDAAEVDGLQLLNLSDSSFFPAHSAASENSSGQNLKEITSAGYVVSTATFSVGYVLWLIRGGSLLASFSSALPLWASLDPLVMIADSKDDENDTEDNESLVEITNSISQE